MRRQAFAFWIAVSVAAWALAVLFAAALLSLVACGGRGAQSCPKPRYAAIDNGGQSPGNVCEVRK